MKLLRDKPYTVKRTSKTSFTYKITLHKEAGLVDGDKAFEVIRPDGVIEIIPEEVYIRQKKCAQS